MANQLYSLSISARATIDMHSLNNEGGEGNQIQTRMVNIVDEEGKLQNVNAISGDMFKHIQAEHLFKIAREAPALPLCAGCREFNANRINADGSFIERTKEMSDAQTISELLHTCTIDDIEGILITEGKRSLPRKSVIEFGWVVGVPGSVETDSYFHVKYAPSERSKTSESRKAEEDAGSNLGQAIFHRPASSGIYAAVAHVELSRIGFNDITQEYAISDEQRNLRARALMESLLYTFMQPAGAMRSSQAPHIVNVEGVVSISTGAVPAPTVSPLKTDYVREIQKTQEALERIAPGKVMLADFQSIGGLTEIIGALMQDYAPYRLQYQ
ncbi:MAG: DevR family CRISPR-associated autoregulator [Anaerolineae bacterium]|nr:MAG: DevR family CRISPR-associated autoregulator [Anaerolineae bacterium]